MAVVVGRRTVPMTVPTNGPERPHVINPYRSEDAVLWPSAAVHAPFLSQNLGKPMYVSIGGFFLVYDNCM